MDLQQLQNLFNSQIQTLIDKGYPKLIGKSEEEFKKLIEPLQEKLKDLPGTSNENNFPFLIVLKSELLKPESAMHLIEVKGQQGIVDMNPVTSEAFSNIDKLEIPQSSVYLLVDVNTGREFLNITPADALVKINELNRTPLNIDEGVALLTQYPEVLTDKEKYNAYSMLGSRMSDQKVPAIWISYKKPRLGWCWNNNPHTWLGSASALKRLG